jgi:repressor LexA
MADRLPARAKLARQEKGMKAMEAAKLLGIARSTLWKYEKGERSPDIDVALNMARVYEVPLDWLLGTTELLRPPATYLPAASKPQGRTIPIPLLGSIPAGIAEGLYEDILCFVEIPQEQSKNVDYFYLQVQDDSMLGSRICAGDLVLVRKQPHIATGEIAVVRTNHTAGSIKRVEVIANQYVLYPDNPNYEPQTVNCAEAQIIGKVIKVEFDPNRKR